MSTVMPPSLDRVDQLEPMVIREFQQMPTLKLTRDQFRRLWDLSDGDCGELLDHLVQQRFLTVDGNGRYGHSPH